MARRRDTTASPSRRTALFPRLLELVGVLQNPQEPLEPIQHVIGRKLLALHFLCEQGDVVL
jgi:hypothetical protein